MYLSTTLLAAATILPTILAQATFQRSSKRGLVFIPSAKYPADNQIWVQPGSDLTWYYNYGAAPSTAYTNRTQAEFEFVPMLFDTSDTTFLTQIKGLIQNGTNVTHTLAFNEPDGSTSTGGTNISPTLAATTWIREVEPLRKLGVKTGAPAVTGSQTGLNWLTSFFAACQSQGTNCTADFIPIHWYGNFEGLASYIGQMNAAYPNISLWMTEYALPHADLLDSQSFFNSSTEYCDRLSYFDRYSYFGSFRSDVSNVGANVAMLDKKGRLTSIGSWYLGGAETNNIPSEGAESRGAISTMVVLLIFAAIAFCLA